MNDEFCPQLNDSMKRECDSPYLETEPKAPKNRPPEADATLALVLAGCAALAVAVYYCGYFGYYSIFTGFSRYDDEGTALMTVTNLAQGRPLYEQSVTTYGPVACLSKLALFKLFRLPINHDALRFLSLALWWGAALMFGIAAWRLGRSLFWFGLAAAASFASLAGITFEPGHPQDICTFLLASCVLLSTFDVTRRPWILAALGAVAGLLCLTKINVGVFCVAALGSTIAFHLQDGRLRTFITVIVTGGLFAGPFLLMRDQLTREWAFLYALNVSSALLGCALVAIMLKVECRGGPRALAGCAGGLVLSVVAVSLLMRAMGTSVGALLHGTVLFAIRVSRTFRIDFEGIPSEWLPIIGFFATLVLTVFLLKSTSAKLWAVVGILRVCGGLAILCSTLVGLTFSDDWESQSFIARMIVTYAPWLMALLMLPPAGGERRPEAASWPRMFLAFAAILEALWAYPVAGTQVLFACVLFSAASCVLLADGIQDLVSQFVGPQPAQTWVRYGAACALLVVTILPLATAEQGARSRHLTSEPLDLPGCDWIRVPPKSGQRYRQLVAELKANADAIFCVPGLPSYYFWAQVPTATAWNLGDWMELLTPPQQQEVIASLEASSRPCIIFDKEMLRFWLQQRVAKSPLLKYIEEKFRPVARTRRGSIAIWVRRDRATFVQPSADGVVEKIWPLTSLSIAK